MAKKPVKHSLLVKAERRHSPPICQLPLTGGRPCLDFVNTIDWRLDVKARHDLLAEYADLLAFTLRIGLIDEATERSLAELARARPEAASRAFSQARAFRDALITIIDDIAGTPVSPPRAFPSPEALALFDAALRRARSVQSYAWKEGRLRLIPSPSNEGLDAPWLSLARDAEALLCSDAASRIRICAATGCGWAFLDTSKNGTRRWCSMQICGNREKARKFKNKEKK
jgi:predicted RNA-binding Zn ribbon-like protein